MQIIEINGKKWTVGLGWEILAGESTVKQEVKEIAEKTQSNYGAVVEYDAIYSIGLVSKAPPKSPSAALWLAVANQEFRAETSSDDPELDWIIVEDAGDDKFWMSVIKSGLPAPGFDVILDITSIKEKLHELMIADTYKMFSSSQEVINLFEGIKHVEKKGINTLTANTEVKIKFGKIRGIPNGLIVAGAAGVGLMIVAWIGVSFMEGRDLEEKAQKFKEQQQAERNRKIAEYNLAMDTYNKTYKANKEKAESDIIYGLAGNPSKILSSWYYTVGNLSVGTHGWTLKNAECYYNLNQPVACDFEYERPGLATNRMLLEDFPTAQIQGNKAVVTQMVNIDNSVLTEKTIQNLNEIKGAKNWGFGMISQLQLMKIVEIDYKLGESTDVTFDVPPRPVSIEEAELGKQPIPATKESIGVQKGDLVVNGSNFDLMKELADNIDFYSTSLRKVKFSFKDLGEIRWEATFNYYIKNGDGTMSASQSANLSSSAIPQTEIKPNGNKIEIVK